jgi:hypothetical protein
MSACCRTCEPTWPVTPILVNQHGNIANKAKSHWIVRVAGNNLLAAEAIG